MVLEDCVGKRKEKLDETKAGLTGELSRGLGLPFASRGILGGLSPSSVRISSKLGFETQRERVC